MKKGGYVYILKCSDGTFYTGSTQNIELRFAQHQTGEGSIYTKSRLPVKLVFWQEFSTIEEAFYREKQVQGWSRNKKMTLISGKFRDLKLFAKCMNETNSKNFKDN